MADLTTLANVKEYLDIESDDTTFDSFLQRSIAASSRQIEAYCNRRFEIQNYSENYDGNASDILFLNSTPIVSVSSLSIDDETLQADEFKVYDDYVRLVSRLFTPGELNVSVDYDAGYFDAQSDPPPADVEDACIQLVAFKFNVRGADGLTQRRANQTADSFAGVAIPLSAAIILDKYRRAKLGTI
ncbi:MAG: phage gp6-like head-tail connector protein [Candidatus Hydrogenedentota bacterium]|nr:MAG: phage gp6-like head-tail connector protein [Candidatus Hydrogenedentota bacterium]